MQVETSRDEAEKARAYLIRNVIVPLHPTCVPLPDLVGICTQVDNITAGLKAERDAATARAEDAERERDEYLAGLKNAVEAFQHNHTEWLVMEAQRDAAIAERDRLREALEIIAGYRQCMDNLMSNVDVARAALTSAKEAGE